MSRIAYAISWRQFASLVVSVLLLAGCGEDDTVAPANPSIAGRWTGSAELGAVQFEATFTQSGETVNGTGRVSYLGSSDDFTATGTVRGQDVALTLLTTDNVMSGYTGRFTGANTIKGNLDPPGRTIEIKRDR